MTWAQFTEQFEGALADPGLATDLAELLPETTDDEPIW